MPRPTDDAIGTKAVQLGFISEEQLMECLETSQLISEGGGSLSLEKIMLRKGYITEFQASQIVKHIEEPAAPIPLTPAEETIDAKASESNVSSIFAQPAVNKPLEEEVLIDSLTRLDLPAADARQDVPRQTIGRCRIVRKIGGGGIGVVYLAEHDVLRKKVALKVLSDHLMQNKEYIERLKQEAVLTSKLNHPNIVQVYDAGIDTGKFYMVLQYIEGENLQRHIDNRGRLDPREAMTIMIEVCKGVGYAHAQGVIHRDIKPENVLISKTNEIRITDFHLAIDAENSATSATRAILLGTPYFVSPELAQGEKADRRADIYSLGVMLYYMVTGRRPFTGKSSIDVLMKHIKEQAIHPRAVDNRIPENLCKIVAKMMAKLPNRRYQKVESVIADLQTVLTQEESNSPIKMPVTPVITTPLRPITRIEVPILQPAPVQLPEAQPVPEPVAAASSPPPTPEPRAPRTLDRERRDEIYRKYTERKTGVGTIVLVIVILLIAGGALAAYLIYAPQQKPAVLSAEKSGPAAPKTDASAKSPQPPADRRPVNANPVENDPAEKDWNRMRDLQKTIKEPAVLRDALLEFVNKYPENRHVKEARELAARYRAEVGEKPPVVDPNKPHEPTPPIKPVEPPEKLPEQPEPPKVVEEPPPPREPPGKEELAAALKLAETDPSSALKAIKEIIEKHKGTPTAAEAGKAIPPIVMKGTWTPQTDLASWKTSKGARAEAVGGGLRLTKESDQPGMIAEIAKQGGVTCAGVKVKFSIPEIANPAAVCFGFAWNRDSKGMTYFGIHGDHIEVIDIQFGVSNQQHSPKGYRRGVSPKANEPAEMAIVWDDQSVYAILNNELAFVMEKPGEIRDAVAATNKGVSLFLMNGSLVIEELSFKKP